MDERAVISKIRGRVGKKAAFHYPGKEKHKHGRLVERAVVRSNPGEKGVPYWDVVDLIEFPGEKKRHWIRIGYYRMPKKRLQWGSQTTITEPVATWKRLLIAAAKEKKRFRNLLVSVVSKLD